MIIRIKMFNLNQILCVQFWRNLVVSSIPVVCDFVSIYSNGILHECVYYYDNLQNMS